MGRKRKTVAVSPADAAAFADVLGDAPVDLDDNVSVSSNLPRSSVLDVSLATGQLRQEETQVKILSLEEEAVREMKLVEELASLRMQEVEIKRLEVEQKLEIQKRLSAIKRDALLAHGRPLNSDGAIVSDSHFDEQHASINKPTSLDMAQGHHDFVDRSLQAIPENSHSLTDLVNSLRQIPNLPSIEITKFDGDPARFIEFRTSFKLQVEQHVQDNVERFLRLLHLCEGKAKTAIQGCINLPPGQMYHTAWKDLTENFGKAFMVAEGQMKRLLDYQIKKDDAESLLAFARRLEEVHRAMSSMGESYLARLNDNELLRKLMRKLPSESLQRRWVEKAGYLLEFEMAVTMKDFIDFVKVSGSRTNNVFGNELKTKGKSLHGSSFALSSDSVEQNSGSKIRDCCICKGVHPTWKCQIFLAKSIAERFELSKREKLCLRCLRKGHFVRDCRMKLKCGECNSGNHNTLLHKEKNPESESRIEALDEEVTVGSTHTDFSKVLLKVLPVRISANGRSIVTHAFLDAGSDTSLCSQALVNSLRLKGTQLNYQLSTVSGTKNQRGTRVNICVSSLDSQTCFDVSCLSVAKIPISDENIARSADLKKYPHLRNIELPTCELRSVSLLIGSDYSAILDSQLDRRAGELDEPVAVKTCLGWTVSGPVGKKTSSSVSINRIGCCDDILRTDFEKLYNSDFGDLHFERRALSPDDKRASDLMNDSVTLRKGHYHVDLPFKKNPEDLRGNFPLAKSRLDNLKRKLERDPNLESQYCRVIKKYEHEGAARLVGKVPTGGRWYIPHHAVMNPNKPDPRVVFDCAAKFKGKSLNDYLFTGPENTSPLVEVLLRFRVDSVAVISDIKSMFHQVRVGDCDSEKISFLWWPTEDFNSDPETFEMRVHLFGASSSPSVCEFALRRTADDHCHEFSPIVVDSVRRDFYVDDLLKSYSSEQEAIKVSSQIAELVSRGGFKLTKWISNRRQVTESFPEEERATAAKKVFDLNLDQGPSAKALGVKWDIEKDLFLVDIPVRDFEKTRRGVLSSVASVFDPLGMTSPLILYGKLINQELCRLQIGWDDDLPPTILASWVEWLRELSAARRFVLGIPRCLRPPHISDFVRIEMHHFSDASEVGYGTASYLRFFGRNGEVHCSFLYGKSRVKPLKSGVTIPKLELTAATLMISVNDLITKSLEGRLHVDSTTYWTDSMIVLKYIHNETKSLTVFVANRVAKIRDVSSPSQWSHVRSENNPADVASRGLRSSDEFKWNLWISGPKFLWEKDVSLHEDSCSANTFLDLELNDSDEGVKTKKVFAAATQCSSFWTTLFQKFSSWAKLQRVVSWVLRAVNRFKGGTLSSPDLSCDELLESERRILQVVQKEAFDDVTDCRKITNIIKLKPFLYRGLLCVGGRLEHANLPVETRHPIILPSKHLITELLISHYHVLNGHVGANHTLSLIRERFWIVHGVSTTRRVLRACLLCKRYNQPPGVQIMAPLPEERVSSDEASFPFEVTGVDLFGPLFVSKNVRTRSQGSSSSLKRYGVIFTCLKCRAIHLEVAVDLTTDSFINCLLRFIARRGAPRVIYSDNGTNFRGAAPELIDGLKRLDQERISRRLIEKHVSWRFNPPGASHRGGVWERMIRSVRRILVSMLLSRRLSDDSLSTLLCEVERILNDRPITKLSDDPADLNCLTPNHILLASRNASIPISESVETNSRLRWKAVLSLAQEFWSRWRKEYVSSLHELQKWYRKGRNFRVGDFVLLVDNNVARGCWKRGIVTDVVLSDDNCVRQVFVRTAEGVVRRDVRKVCLMEEAVITCS